MWTKYILMLGCNRLKVKSTHQIYLDLVSVVKYVSNQLFIYLLLICAGTRKIPEVGHEKSERCCQRDWRRETLTLAKQQQQQEWRKLKQWSKFLLERFSTLKPKWLQRPIRRKENTIRANEDSQYKRPNRLRRGKMRATTSWFVFVFHLIS